MKKDFLNELATLALGSRLKRLSEKMMTDASNVYRHFGLDIQPKWFTLLALLANKESVSVVEASEYLGLSQPAVSQFCRQLETQGLIKTVPAPSDSRRKMMVLSEEGRQRVLAMQPIWDAVHLAAEDLCSLGDNDFYKALQKYEQALDEGSLFSRTLKHFEASDDISIVPFRPELAKYFDEINREWISTMFELEDIDEQVITRPQQNILDGGGKIWFARHKDLGIVGTCALLNKGNGNYELTKMGVLSKARGLKVGEKLLQFVVDASQSLPVETLFLLTNAKCEAAIHLYEKNGFEHDKGIMERFGGAYQRCDVAMLYVGK